MVVVLLLLAVLGVGAVFVVKSFLASPESAKARTSRDGAAAIEAGLEAAAQYQRDQKFPEANAILDKLAEQSPTDRAVRVAYAQALLGQKRWADAYKQYEAAISLGASANKTAAQTQRDPVQAQLHFEAGTAANMAQVPDRAEEHYWMAQSLDAAEPRYPLYLAMIQIRKGDDAAAAASLARTVKVNPDMAEAWGTMAELELKKNQLSLAGQHVEKARTLQPQVSRWRIVQARILNRQGDAKEAAAILAALPAADRMNKSVLTLRSESFGLLSRPMEAAAMYEEALGKSPSDAELAYQAALWYQRANMKEKAVELAKRAAMLGHEGAKELAASLDR